MTIEPLGEPLTSLEEQASSLHELFVSYVRAGFTRPEALYLVAAFLSASLGGPYRAPREAP